MLDNIVLNWEKLKTFLPISDTEYDRDLRIQIFEQFDTDHRNSISMDEIVEGYKTLNPATVDICNEQYALEEAFAQGKEFYGDLDKIGNKLLTAKEFRIFLVYLYQYFEYFQVFKTIDSNHDDKIDVNEFEKGKPIMQKWGITIESAEEEYAKIVNLYGPDITLHHFSNYFIKKSLKIYR